MAGMRVGVLALQGDYGAHVAALGREGIEGAEVRYAAQLETLEGLILPGGESTTLLHLIGDNGFSGALRRFHERGGAIFGTCAGAILLARRVTNPVQPSFGFIDIDIERNAFGRQIDSFETRRATSAFRDPPLEMVFIRAPRIRRIGPGVEVLAEIDGEPVLVRQDRVLAGTFHPELARDGRVHRLFAEMAAAPRLTTS